MALALRLDAGTVRGGLQRTPQGGVRVPAALARTGVQRYQDTDGKSWAEYRPPSEVFAADALATLRAAPITEGHPASGRVDAASWKALAIGHVGDGVRPEGDFVVSDVCVQDAAAVARVEAGELKELSVGYTCEVDWTPGVTPEGERYDAVQRQIRANHVGLGPDGWGRAGAGVALRTDADAQAAVAYPGGVARAVRLDAAAEKTNTAAQVPAAGATMRTITIGGKVYRLDAEGDIVAAQGAVDETVKKADADAGELSAVKAALMDALTKVASLEAKMAVATAATPPPAAEPAEPSEEMLDARLALREATRADAALVLGADAKLAGLKLHEIKRAVVAKALPETKLDGLSADVLEGMYRATVAGAKSAARTPEPTRNDALAAAHKAAVGDPAARQDAADADPQDVMAKNREAQRAAARKKGL